MKLWIRNQTRTEIMECNHLSTKETIIPNKKKSEWCIVANFGWVGTYESMERCLEILDDIFRTIATSYSQDNLLYDMPNN